MQGIRFLIAPRRAVAFLFAGAQATGEPLATESHRPSLAVTASSPVGVHPAVTCDRASLEERCALEPASLDGLYLQRSSPGGHFHEKTSPAEPGGTLLPFLLSGRRVRSGSLVGAECSTAWQRH